MMQQSRNHKIHPRRCAIGFDVGGTKIAAVVVSGDGQIHEQLVVPMPRADTSNNDVMEILLDVAAELRSRYRQVEAIGAGAAGIVEWPDGFIRWAPNSPYEGLPLRKFLEHGTGLPVVVDNDANVAAWAEAVLGRGVRRYQDFIFLTVGTGIGGGVLLNGEIYRGPAGVATELGHIIVDPGGPICGCGNRGCLEAVASGTALVRNLRQSVRDNPDSSLARRLTNSADITGQMLYAAALEGDDLARAMFHEAGYWLGVGIATITNIFEVEAVVIGGGLVDVGDLLLEPARSSAAEYAFAPRHRPLPPISPGTFASHAGVVGAAHIALWHTDQSIRRAKYRRS
jgi:glucokinase